MNYFVHMVLLPLPLEHQQKPKVLQRPDFYAFQENPANLAAVHDIFTRMPT